MRIYIQTDMEGVAGICNFEQWTSPGARYNELGCELLTREVNAAVDGLFAGGATYIMVADSHGPGAIDIGVLDPRVEMMRWDWRQPWPQRLQEDFDYLVFVGQHAKSRTALSNMAHTGNCGVLERSINGVAIGEFGQHVACASELGIRTILATGEQALAGEAQNLVPCIETVAVKRGLQTEHGDSLTAEEYREHNPGAVHVHPEVARQRIHEGAEHAMGRAAEEEFGVWPLTPPYRMVTVYRKSEDNPGYSYTVREHPTSVIEAMNQPAERRPIASEEQLNGLLVEPLEG